MWMVGSVIFMMRGLGVGLRLWLVVGCVLGKFVKVPLGLG